MEFKPLDLLNAITIEPARMTMNAMRMEHVVVTVHCVICVLRDLYLLHIVVIDLGIPVQRVGFVLEKVITAE